MVLGITLIYESGTIGARPETLPLSFGDGELCDTALVTVSVPEIFQYWLQGGRISIGMLGAAQLDRFGNINTTVIGDYHNPKVRLPGGGGAPEIATHCGEVIVLMPHSRRGLVPELDFLTSLGFGRDGRERERLGLKTRGPGLLVTDLCAMRPGKSHELEVVSIHPGVSLTEIKEKTGWSVVFADGVEETPSPTDTELEVLRDLVTRSDRAHHGAE